MGFTLVYDTWCGPCTRFRNVVGFLDAKKNLRYVGLKEADLSGILDRVPWARRHRSFHLVSPSGNVLSGADALPELLSLLPAGKVPSMALESPMVLGLAAFAYSVLSRLHDSGSCGFEAHSRQSPMHPTGKLQQNSFGTLF